MTYSLCLSQRVCVSHIHSVSVTDSLCLSQTVSVCHRQSVSVTDSCCPLQKFFVSENVCFCHTQYVSVTDSLCLSQTVCFVTYSLCLSKTCCVCHRNLWNPVSHLQCQSAIFLKTKKCLSLISSKKYASKIFETPYCLNGLS